MNHSTDRSLFVPDSNGSARNGGLFALNRLSFAWSRSQVELLAFCLIVLSLLDLLTTYVLLRSFTECYEANPIADFFFKRWNILGMTLFKFTLVGVVIAACEIIERSRPRWGNVVLVFACVAATAVVLKGLHIFNYMTGLPFSL
jgi:hypothetical protein